MPVSSWVNSVEFIDAVISGSNNSATYNLSKGQNYANCIPFYTVCGNVAYWDSRVTDVYFSGTTQSGIINFSRAANRSTSNYVKCYVVEFNPEQVRVQQGTFTLTGTTTQTVTLPTTLSGTDRAAMTFGWQSNDTAQYTSRVAVRGRVVSTTSIDFYRYSSTSTCTGHWFLFEDKGDNFRSYHLYGSHGTGQTLDISGQKTVDPLRTFVLGSSTNDSPNAYPSYFSNRIFLYSTGTVRSDKNNATYLTYWAAQIVEILDQTKIYVPMDHALVGWTTPASYNREVGGVSGRIPFTCNPQTSTVVTAMMQGFVRGETSVLADIVSSMATSELTSSGTITHTKFGTSVIAYPSYTVAVDWAGISVDTGFNPSPIPKGNGPGQSFVKSVENFRFTLSGNIGICILTKGQTISNCAIFSSNRSVSSNTLNAICVNVYLKEPGLVYMQHWSDTEQAIVDCSVVEFYPDQVKVQQFNINNSSATTVNVPIEEISSVNKAFILSSVFTPYNGGPAGLRYSFYRISFTSTTNVELYKNSSGYETVCSFFVIEDLQDNFVVEHQIKSFTSSDNLYSEIYNWGGHNSFPIITYTTNNPNDYASYGCIRGYYNSEYRPIYSDKDNATYTIYWIGTMVKFIDNKRHSFPISKTLSNQNTLVNNYPIEMVGTENITAYNTIQYSTISSAGNTVASSASEGFGTITITDYNNGSYEVSKGGGTSYTSYIGAHIINWPGYHYQSANNVTGTQTRSFINSIQKDFFETDGSFMQVWLRYNQDISKCVPFMVNSGAAIDGYTSRLSKAIYRYDDPDCFRIRFSGMSTTYRKILCYMIEFNQNIKVQYGSGYSVGTSKTFDIEEVNLDRAFLQFYICTDNWERPTMSSSVCGYFSSSTQLTFIRNTATGAMYISWYVVECPDWGTDSYWRVYHNTTGNLGSGTTVYSWLTTQPVISRSICLFSFANDDSMGYPYTGLYRIFNRQDHGVQIDKSSGTYGSMIFSNTEIIEFSPFLSSIGFKVYGNFYTLATDTNMTYSLKLKDYDYLHIQRSMVILANNENATRVDTSNFDGHQEGYHYFELLDGEYNSFSRFNNTSMVHSSRTILNGAVINVSDGSNSSYYQTTYTGASEWVSIDLGVSKSIWRICITARNGYNNRLPKNFRVESSSNNLDWETTYSGTTILTGSNQFFVFPSKSSLYRYWRLYMLDNWGDTSNLLTLSKFELYDVNQSAPKDYSNTISISKTTASYTSYGFYYAIQFPKFNKYYFSGYVTEQGDAVSRKVAAYKYSTGELVDVDMSISGTGYFYLETPDYEPHYIVALDDDEGFSYNDLIYGKIYPTVISGAFGWIAGTTFTGIGEYTQ